MWDVWSLTISSIRWIHWSYYLYSYCRVMRQNKKVGLLKLHGDRELGFSHLWHWSYLLMSLQQGILCESWIEDIPKKYQRHSKSPWYLWIWYCQIFCQEWKWTYDCAPGSGISCFWVTKVFVHHLPTRHFHIRRIKEYLHSSFSLWAW